MAAFTTIFNLLISTKISYKYKRNTRLWQNKYKFSRNLIFNTVMAAILNSESYPKVLRGYLQFYESKYPKHEIPTIKKS
jgi:hypothetical protein